LWSIWGWFMKKLKTKMLGFCSFLAVLQISFYSAALVLLYHLKIFNLKRYHYKKLWQLKFYCIFICCTCARNINENKNALILVCSGITETKFVVLIHFKTDLKHPMNWNKFCFSSKPKCKNYIMKDALCTCECEWKFDDVFVI
jgi:hypothetical protein